ncbi:hypothetical protein V8G54_024145 [Vigna mungo]|uniref:Myb-like domain-containing protein n=1 Tax=Vigna mungo TaxID=3915 RepID=A0AAQ3RPV3_VIGMU
MADIDRSPDNVSADSKEKSLQTSTVEFSEAEEILIAMVYNLVGERWSLIAGRIPGRTAEEIEKVLRITLQKELTIAAVHWRDDLRGGEKGEGNLKVPVNQLTALRGPKEKVYGASTTTFADGGTIYRYHYQRLSDYHAINDTFIGVPFKVMNLLPFSSCIVACLVAIQSSLLFIAVVALQQSPLYQQIWEFTPYKSLLANRP